jgi:FKBP-type peptidyl-prolyl cis-trans isomerase 2
MANNGERVFIHYKGTLDDGTVFDSSEGRQPLNFIVGSGMVIPGFDAAARELAMGQTTKVRLESEDAYGDWSEENVQVIPLDQIPNSENLPVGQTIYLQGPQGQPIATKVTKIEDGNAHFDFNHELAGKALTFEMTRVEEAKDDTCCDKDGCDEGGCDCGCGC